MARWPIWSVSGTVKWWRAHRGRRCADTRPTRGSLENEPLQRLTLLTLTNPSNPLIERITLGIKGLRELKFPVIELERDSRRRS